MESRPTRRDMIKIHGGDLGMKLADVRRFVQSTGDLPDETWVDCEIPGHGGNQVAALMGLMA